MTGISGASAGLLLRVDVIAEGMRNFAVCPDAIRGPEAHLDRVCVLQCQKALVLSFVAPSRGGHFCLLAMGSFDCFDGMDRTS
jgi:hypothetical protein